MFVKHLKAISAFALCVVAGLGVFALSFIPTWTLLGESAFWANFPTAPRFFTYGVLQLSCWSIATVNFLILDSIGLRSLKKAGFCRT